MTIEHTRLFMIIIREKSKQMIQQTCFSHILDCYTVRCYQQNQGSRYQLKVRKTQEGGLNYVSFFFVFSKLKHTDQKQLGTTSEVMFRTKMQRIKSERDREKKDTKQLYRFLPQSRSSPVPLALPRRVH